MKLRTILLRLCVLAVISYFGYHFFFKKAEKFLDIDSAIPVYHYKFELPKEPKIDSLEFDVESRRDASVESVAKAAEPVQFKRTDPEGYLKNMCTYRQQNKEENCNSLVGVAPRPISSGDPTFFTQF